MNSSPDPARIALAAHERPRAVRAHDGAIGVAALVRRVEAACEARVVRVAEEAERRARTEMAAEVETLVRGCRDEVDLLRDSLLDNAIELAAVLAETAVHQALAGGIDVAPAVRACFERSGADAATCRVRVHPDALAALESAGITDRLDCKGDRDLAPGEVRLDTPVGTLVHEPFAALEQARDALLTQLAGPHAGDAPNAEAA